MTKSKKTIAIDIRLLGKRRTGDEAVFFHLSREILKIDTVHEYRLLTDELDADKIKVLARILGCAGQGNVRIVSLPAPNRFVWNLWTLPRYLFRNTVDIFHTQYILPMFIPRRTKVVVHIHDVSFCVDPTLIAWSDRLFLSLLIPYSLRRSTLIIAPSRFTKSEIIRYYGVASDKITVVANAIGEDFLRAAPVDPERDRALREKYHLPERFILSVGTLQPRKNIPFLIEAFAMLSARLRTDQAGITDMKLVIVGKRDGHNADKNIGRSIAKHKLDTMVVFPGYIDQGDLPHIVRLADIFVFPSLYEGFGIPLLEAMSQGVPIVASDIPSLREVGGDAALYFAAHSDPANLANCAEKLYTLLIDRKQHEALIRRGKARFHIFSWQKSARLLYSEYIKLLKI